MIWTWIATLWRGIKLLLVPPPRSTDSLLVDPNEKCPACGARSGKLMCTKTETKVYVEHTCNVCHARWYSLTVVDDKREELIHPADYRDYRSSRAM